MFLKIFKRTRNMVKRFKSEGWVHSGRRSWLWMKVQRVNIRVHTLWPCCAGPRASIPILFVLELSFFWG